MKKEIIERIIAEKKGTVKVEEVVNAGISKQYFYDYVKKNGLEKVAHGVYITKDTWEDPFYIMQLKCPQIIFSHESALYLWNMVDREPLECPVTVKTGYHSKYLEEMNVRVHNIKADTVELGVTMTNTPYGNPVRVFDRERTICDIIRDRSRIEMQDFQTGMREYVKYPQKNIHILMQYAKAFRVERILRTYLEVLL